MLDISIIIPFRDKSELTLDCLRTLHSFGDPVKEILLVSNNSTADELARIKDAAKKHNNTRVIEYNHPFNFHKINNWAASQAKGKVLFFLNNDVELIEKSRGLLAYMHQTALQSDVGAVGCTLLYEDQKTIQHAGVYLVPGGTADHMYIGKSYAKIVADAATGQLPYDTTEDIQLSAVTAAAVMVEKKKFDQIHGMNEDFIICGGDVDLCLRLQDAGYKTILVGSSHGLMVHKESKSRSMLAVPYQDFCESYKIYVTHFNTEQGDPYLHWRNLQHA